MSLLMRLALALSIVVFGALVSRKPDAARRARRGNAWAQKHLAYVDASLVSEFDRLLDVRRRRGLWLLALLVVAIVVVPLPGAWGMWPWLGGICAVASVLSLAFLTRWVTTLEPGPRVARGRQVELADLLPGRLRALMWASVAVLLTLMVGTLASPADRGATIFLALMLVLMSGSALAVEILGRLLAHAPEPAVDAAHLYWQDAMRAEAVTTQARQVAFGASVSCGVIWQNDLWHAGTAVDTLSGLASFTLLGLVIVAELVEVYRPASHLRARLWPHLAPREVAGPVARVPA